ncbi:MAG: MFS transporter, partial [Clostridia bacterium]|nr:MFS transporter [Clostridia bacterium]
VGYLVFLCWFVYTMAYCGRYSYTANISTIRDVYGISNGTAGLVSTFFFFVYGAGQIVNGLLCKYYNKRYVIGIALLVTALSNGVLAFGIPFTYFKYVWLVNGAAQSFLWSSIMSIIGKNVPIEKLRLAGLVMSTTVAIGKFASFGLATLALKFGGFQFSFAFGCGALLIASAVWLITYHKAVKKPTAVAETVTDTAKTAQAEGSSSAKAQEIASKKSRIPSIILASVVLLGVFAVVVNLVLDGFMTWMPTILESYGLDNGVSIALGMLLPVFGVVGSFGVTYLNKLVPSYVTLCGLLMAAVCAFLGTIMGVSGAQYWFVVLLCICFISCLMTCCNNIITNTAPLFLRKHINSGLLSGVLDGCCYVGSAISAYGFGSLADKSGWGGVFTVLLIACGAAVLIAFVFAIVTRKRQRELQGEND